MRKAIKDFEYFDRLPKPIRQALSESPINWDSESIYRWYSDARRYGYPDSELIRVAIQKARETNASH